MSTKTDKTKEAQQSRIIPYEAFDLRTVKVDKDSVTIVEHIGGIDAGTITYKGEGAPHPDLKEALEALDLYAVTRLGLLEGWDFSREKIKKDQEALAQAMQGHNNQVERWTTSGIHFKGSEEKAGVHITGSLKCPVKDSTGLACPRIPFEAVEGQPALGYEEDVADLAETVKKEAYYYRYKGKRAQLSIPIE